MSKLEGIKSFARTSFDTLADPGAIQPFADMNLF